VRTAVYRFPTPEPEADGTLQWDATIAVVVTLHAGGHTGLGWTYSSSAAATARVPGVPKRANRPAPIKHASTIQTDSQRAGARR